MRILSVILKHDYVEMGHRSSYSRILAGNAGGFVFGFPFSGIRHLIAYFGFP